MPQKDRLEELKKLHETTPNKKDKNKDVQASAKKMKKKVEEIEKIRGVIKGINNNTETCKKILNDGTSQTFANMHDKNVELKQIFELTERSAKVVLHNLKDLNVQSTNSEGYTQAEQRIMRMQYLTLHKEFSEVIEEHYNFVEKHKNIQKEMLMQMARTVNKHLDDDEIENLLEQDALGNLFTDNYLVDVQQAKQNLQDIQTRHKELLTIEEHIREIRDLFQTIALNIDSQQDRLNRIEDYATKTSDVVEDAERQLENAVTNRNKKRKLYIILSSVGTFLVIVMIGALFI